MYLYVYIYIYTTIKVELEKCQKFISINDKCNVYQEQLHRHFNSEEHNWMEITVTDRAENDLELRCRESCWQRSLDTFIPNGLNESFAEISVIICFTFPLGAFIVFAT